jgi:hypothetical protein
MKFKGIAIFLKKIPRKNRFNAIKAERVTL